MIHPLFRLIVSDPQLLADHVEAYSDLMADELGAAAKRWKMRAVMNLVFGVSAFVSVIFLGMALMLWAVVPVDNMHSPWALVLVPAIPLVVALWSFMAARAPSEEPGFSAIREQLAADAAMLRSVTAP
jgi:uncharacterized membrane protein YqjE